MLGFIILRHVNNKMTDLYWKECYTCIRKYYTNPILIIDDNSNRDFLNENIVLKNCTVIYDTDHKGCGELLPYYYFHKLKPFDTAVMVHDSVFIQTPINFNLNSDENIKFLWSFDNGGEYLDLIYNISSRFENVNELMEIALDRAVWAGCFGCMSVIRWELVDRLNKTYSMFDTLLPIINVRHYRCAFERVLPILVYSLEKKLVHSYFGSIHHYMPWGTPCIDYLDGKLSMYPIVKVWTGR